MITALVGIAATIYIFKFLTGLFKPNPASGVAHKSTAAVATGQTRRASAAMRPRAVDPAGMQGVSPRS